MISTDFNDLIVFNIRDSDTTFAAVYLPPTDSKYYSKDYFDALDLICDTFTNNTQFYAFGDFNCRIGTPVSPIVDYQPNPDTEINSHGRNLLDIIDRHNLTIVNGCIRDNLICDSAFTYFKANNRSQIDLTVCNNINKLRSFQIVEKCFISDHCPVTFSVGVNVRPPMSIVRECSRYSLSYDHLDINKRLPTPINVKRINATKLVIELEKLSVSLNQLSDFRNVDSFANHLSVGIYNACKASQKKEKVLIPAPNPNCTSKNIRAICAAHFYLYTHKISCKSPTDEINDAAKMWWDYNCLAQDMERKEYNTKVNKKWANCKKNDPRQMWKMVDWKGQSQQLPSAGLDPVSVNSYFKNIFQSEKTIGHPTITDIRHDIDTYSSVDNPINELLNKPISMDELKPVLRNVGRGIGLDGIPPVVSNLFPESLCDVILKFLRVIFDDGTYPKPWSMQLLFPIEKKGHTLSSPKLRGIAISSLLARIYDSIINNRFNSWYHPNKEQSGFRKSQGCILQLLYVSLLLELADSLQKSLYLLLIDYEKAFDYANRAVLIQDMMDQDIGDTFVRAVAAMYEESIYVPKVGGNMLGDMINTFYGVTQGRRSSTSFFSFLIREMANAIHTYEYDDFVEPHNMAQMADDTMLAAELRESLGPKFESVYEFSDDKKQSINIDKTLYVHMSKSPDTQPISCSDGNITVSSLEVGKSAPYLGLHLIHTNKLRDIIEYNVNKRMFNVSKFKSWLEVNKNTPFAIKLLVLDSSVLPAILNGFEAWGDLSFIRKKLETIELDLLKSTLGVKKGTPTNLVYHELNRGSIVTKLMDRQKAFVGKVDNLSEDEALVKCVWNRCQHLNICQYYNSLSDDNYESNKLQRVELLNQSTKTMDERYRSIIGLSETNCIYDSYVVDSCRTVLTRWRLSNFELAIETGRYRRPKIEREQRLCQTCLAMEDEYHVFFVCPLYNQIRANHPNLFNEPYSVKKILNPTTRETLYETAYVLFEIEKTHAEFTR